MNASREGNRIVLSVSDTDAQALLQLAFAVRFQRLFEQELHPQDKDAMQRTNAALIDKLLAAEVKPATALPWSVETRKENGPCS